MTQALPHLPLGNQVFLVELDALLDTRLGVAATLDEDAWNEIAQNPEYFTRETDDLSLFTKRFTKEEYAEAWNKRDTTCLEFALITNYIRQMAASSAELHRDLVNKNNPHVTRVEFCINMYPYRLDKEEKGLIEECIRSYLMPGMNVSSCYLPPQTLNFAYLRANYTGLVLYNFREWMEHCEDPHYEGPGAPQVTVLAPALFGPEGKPTEKEIHEGLNVNGPVENDVLFGLTEYTMSSMITLAFQDPLTFSVIVPESA